MLVLIIIVVAAVIVLIRNPRRSCTENPSPQKGNRKMEKNPGTKGNCK